MSQTTLANAVGVKYQTIQDLESNKSQGSKHIVALARALGVMPTWLEKGEGRKVAPLDEQPTEAAENLEIGRHLLLAREAARLSVPDLCLRTGIPQKTYLQWESAEMQPSVKEVNVLRRHFGLTLDWIFYGDPSGLPHKLAARIAELEQALPISGMLGGQANRKHIRN